jgi:predicted Zn-dependent protease
LRYNLFGKDKKMRRFLILFVVITLAFGASRTLSIAQEVQPTPQMAEKIAQFWIPYQQSVAALNAGKFAVAEKFARQCEAADPDNPTLAYQSLAPALAGEGKTAEAKQIWGWLDLHNNSEPDVMLPYALLLLKEGKYDPALKIYDRCSTFLPIPITNGSQLLVEDSDYLSDTKDPKHLESNIHIALAFLYDTLPSQGHALTGNPLAEYSKAYSLEPESAIAAIGYAKGLKEAGRNSEARAILQKVASTSTGDAKDAATNELLRVPTVDRPKHQAAD